MSERPACRCAVWPWDNYPSHREMLKRSLSYWKHWPVIGSDWYQGQVLWDNFTFSSILYAFLVEFSIMCQLFFSCHLEVPVLSTMCSCKQFILLRGSQERWGARGSQVLLYSHTVFIDPGDNNYISKSKSKSWDTLTFVWNRKFLDMEWP